MPDLYAAQPAVLLAVHLDLRPTRVGADGADGTDVGAGAGAAATAGSSAGAVVRMKWSKAPKAAVAPEPRLMTICL